MVTKSKARMSKEEREEAKDRQAKAEAALEEQAKRAGLPIVLPQAYWFADTPREKIAKPAEMDKTVRSAGFFVGVNCFRESGAVSAGAGDGRRARAVLTRQSDSVGR